MWLVVPAEAAGAAQAAEGVAAAAAAAAVGANGVLNFLAGLEDDTAGDLQILIKGSGGIRIMSTNPRRMKRDQTGQDMSKVVWEQTMRAVEDAAVDIWAAHDTRAVNGGPPGQAALAEATTLVETTTGQAASTVEAMRRELVWRRSWRRLETTGRQRS